MNVPVQIFQVTLPKVIVASNVELNYIKSLNFIETNQPINFFI